MVHEYVGNMHMHTPYSDGEGYHARIAQAAIKSGLDFIIVTDHNVWVDGLEGYYGSLPDQQVLLLVGEEVHDQRRDPQVNHLLVYGAETEVAQFAPDPQQLIDQVKEHEGLCYLAHPVEKAALLFHEPALPWVDLDVEGYTGIELWNYMTEFKSYLSSKLAAVRAAFNPDKYISGPFPETLNLWDRLLAEGKPVRAIGGADAHATPYSMGPVRRVVFPYEYLFRCVNTHILTPHPFDGNYEHDKLQVLNALRNGHSFVGYDFPASTRGFRFSAQGLNMNTIMGGRVRVGDGVTLQVVLPRPADMRILRDGKIIFQNSEATHYTHIATQPGIYRVEAYIDHKGKKRGWIFSNPIFVVD